MPELPDLEVYKDNIFHRLTSKHLVGLEVYNLNKVVTPAAFLTAELAGRELLAVTRSGKELYFDFGEERVISAHLMLNGIISIVPHEAAAALKFKIFSLQFERGTLVFSDKGGLCTIKYKPAPSKVPDALAANFSLEFFARAARVKAMTNVKAFLIDQSVVRGIGNAYADEILYDCKISPHTLTGRLPKEKISDLYYSISSVLKAAIISIKKISPDIISGEERSFLKVHNKNLKMSATGYPIIFEVIASKYTYYTKEQILY